MLFASNCKPTFKSSAVKGEEKIQLDYCNVLKIRIQGDSKKLVNFVFHFNYTFYTVFTLNNLLLT